MVKYTQQLLDFIRSTASSEEHGHKEMNPAAFARHLNKEHGSEINSLSYGGVSRISAFQAYKYHPDPKYSARYASRTGNEQFALQKADKLYEDSLKTSLELPSAPQATGDPAKDALLYKRYAKDLGDYAKKLKKSKRIGNTDAASDAYSLGSHIEELFDSALADYRSLVETKKTVKKKREALAGLEYMLQQIPRIGRMKKKHNTKTVEVVEKLVDRIVEVPVEKVVERVVEKLVPVPVEKVVYISPEQQKSMTREDRLLAEQGPYIAIMLHQLDRHGKWGNSNTTEDQAQRAFAKHDRGKLKGVYSYLKSKGYLWTKPSAHGIDISLNPDMRKEIEDLVARYIPENNNSVSS